MHADILKTDILHYLSGLETTGNDSVIDIYSKIFDVVISGA